MSKGARRAHGVSRVVRRLVHQVLRIGWQCVRVLCVLFAAMGPELPPSSGHSNYAAIFA